MGQRLYKRADSPNWYTTIAGKGVSTGCRDRRAAEARSAALERAAYAPADPTPNTPTLAAALEHAMSERRGRGRAEGTLHMYGIKVGHLERVLGPETRLGTIDAKAIDRFTAQRLEEGAHRNTVAKELGVLRVALKLARRRGEYPHDPAAVMPVGWSAEYTPRTRALSPEEARVLLGDLLGEVEQRRGTMANRAGMVAFIIATSARWSEAERARREDVGEGYVALRGTKTVGAARVVPVLPTTAPLLAIAMGHGREAGELFEPWQNVRRDLHAACERLGIPPVSPNDLRRTTATWLRAAGVEPHLIAAVLGHRDARMVERVYGRITPEALGEALRARVGGVVPLLPVAGKAGKKTRRTG